jgi:hypothetical protein
MGKTGMNVALFGMGVIVAASLLLKSTRPVMYLVILIGGAIIAVGVVMMTWSWSQRKKKDI